MNLKTRLHSEELKRGYFSGADNLYVLTVVNVQYTER